MTLPLKVAVAWGMLSVFLWLCLCVLIPWYDILLVWDSKLNGIRWGFYIIALSAVFLLLPPCVKDWVILFDVVCQAFLDEESRYGVPKPTGQSGVRSVVMDRSKLPCAPDLQVLERQRSKKPLSTQD